MTCSAKNFLRFGGALFLASTMGTMTLGCSQKADDKGDDSVNDSADDSATDAGADSVDDSAGDRADDDAEDAGADSADDSVDNSVDDSLDDSVDDDATDAGDEASQACESWSQGINDPDIELSSPVPAVVGAWIGSAGAIAVASDIRASGSVDSADLLTFDGDFTMAGFNGATFVGHQEKSVIEKYEVRDGKLELVGDVDFQNWGVTDTDSGSRFVIKFVDEDTALYFDHSLAKAFKFNPTDMSTTGAAIDYSALYEGLDLGAEDWPDVRDVGTLGDKFIVPMYNWHGEDMLPWTRVAIVDPSDDSVVIAEDDRCSGSNRITYDREGNAYFGPHSASALGTFEMADHPGPCVLRLNVGETEIDSDYFLELNDIANPSDFGVEILTGGYQGAGGLSYFLGFSGDPSLGPAARWEDGWQAYAVDLSSECPELKKVEGWPLSNSEPRAFSLMVDGEEVHFVTVTTNDSGVFFVSANPDGSVTKQLSMEAWPNIAVPQ